MAPDGHTNWILPLQAPVLMSPAIAADGTIYTGTYSNSLGTRLYSIKPSGTTNWVFNLGSLSTSLMSVQFPSPAIGPDGTIYVGSFDKKVYAILPNGQKKWTFQMTNVTYVSPAIGDDGTIYIGSDDGNFYALAPNGMKKWQYYAGGQTDSSPAVGSDGSIYFGTSTGFYALDRTGHLNWSITGQGAFLSSPAVCADGSVVFASLSGHVYRYTAAGALVSSGGFPDAVYSSPAIGRDGTIYLACRFVLFALQGTNGLSESAWPMLHRDLRHQARSIQRGIEPPNVLSEGGVSLTLNVETGRNYTLQGSTDLVSWIDVTNFVSDSTRPTVADPDGAVLSNRFYRLRTP
jgi:outer membrane protein assembly factor BamB